MLDAHDIKGKRVLVRVDFNVPLDPSGQITDKTRIRAALPTIKALLKKGAAVILMSHLGRPKGKRDLKFSLLPVASCLARLLDHPVQMAPDCLGVEVDSLVRGMGEGDVLLLENLRFYEAEEKPDLDSSFAKRLSQLGEFYVNDAFGTAHRSHASNVEVTKYFPGKCSSGVLLDREVEFLRSALLKPKHPVIALIGGAKISSKIGVLRALKEKVDHLLIGGGMAYTFLKAKGIPIGESIHEDDFLDAAAEMVSGLTLPQDLVIRCGQEHRVIEVADGIPSGYEGVDIGPKTIGLFTEILKGANTVFWNGPVGIFEEPPFHKGTEAIAKVLADLDAVTIVGGGDSVSAVQQLGLGDAMTHISTGGGASLELIEKGSLPALEALHLENCR